ncbi:MAG TPA: DUF2062 domain-containing protein [Vicinamibacterales bacterium]|nr:DUF2062 domain-containing protein [Vicinamibacterales bacterium]
MKRFPRIRRFLEALLHTHDTPHRTAAAFALGVFFGFSPFLGLHTVLGLVCAFLLNLNRIAVVLGVYSNLPWILPAYYTVATVAGAALLGVEVPTGLVEGLLRALMSASWSTAWNRVRSLTPLVEAFLLGSTLGAVVLAGCAYYVSLGMIVAHRRLQAHKRLANP